MTESTAMTTAELPGPRGLAYIVSQMRPQITESLPPGIDPDRFVRVAMNAIQNMPELTDPKVERQSVFNACLRAAQLGLMPDKREGAIVIVNEKRKGANGQDVWVKVAQFRDMVGGLRKLAAEFGFDLIARSVYENDDFDYQLGDDEMIRHKAPKLGTDRGALVGAYAIATRLKDGRKYRLVMDMAAINKRRDVAQTKAVWDKWPSEMSEKTVARSIFRVLPLADSDDAAAERFDRLVTKEDEVDVTAERAQEAIRATAQAEPVQQSGSRRPRGLETVAAAGAQDRQDFDPGTGEVIDSTATVVEPQDSGPPADAHF